MENWPILVVFNQTVIIIYVTNNKGGDTMYKRTKKMCHLENPPNT
jgi:hypothetical protein